MGLVKMMLTFSGDKLGLREMLWVFYAVYKTTRRGILIKGYGLEYGQYLLLLIALFDLKMKVLFYSSS